ncbi:hypothetical protein RHGRI_020672 [Rhododendron griersonianum]|uniref:RNA polymerase sigma-70 domain-containing protein n=1 Tax=Rhododendron griersonianum TaxID=479676 RepID=A0AAV6JJ75_9ERIC|nr:hypothetical protein RHGRI_020672 [Rhododendron griersonianum]KAG5540533.1 hypothetical protein RHGRI_020672 [Rhododendron griersonianum]
MRMGFNLNLKLVTPIRSPFLSNAASWSSLCTSRCRDPSYDSGTVPFAFFISWQSENLYNDPLKAHKSSSAQQTAEKDYLEMEGVKILQMTTGENKLQGRKASHFGLLMENLDMLEATFADSYVGRLERDILGQLERVGALKLFHTCLLKTLKSPTFFDLSDMSTQLIKQPLINEAVDVHIGEILVDDLERIKTVLEEEIGQVASLSSWAEAARMDKKILLQHLRSGWYCKDELLRSAHSLVMYLARNYRGFGFLAFEDIIQAGKFGLLQGAMRFDHTRGYKFSTYVQYWIRRSMSRFVEQHSRGIRIPASLSKSMNQIKKARNFLYRTHGRYPDDDEIAKFTGLSLANIQSARQCFRVVGSIDERLGDSFGAKFMEFTPDTSVESTEEFVVRQQMVKEIHDLLKTLDLTERQVLVMRFGLCGHHRKSLQEIGTCFQVSKEWIRRVELKALRKLRDEGTRRNLSHYLQL